MSCTPGTSAEAGNCLESRWRLSMHALYLSLPGWKRGRAISSKWTASLTFESPSASEPMFAVWGEAGPVEPPGALRRGGGTSYSVSRMKFNVREGLTPTTAATTTIANELFHVHSPLVTEPAEERGGTSQLGGTELHTTAPRTLCPGLLVLELCGRYRIRRAELSWDFHRFVHRLDPPQALPSLHAARSLPLRVIGVRPWNSPAATAASSS